MQMERRSMRWVAAAMAAVYLSACGGGGGDAPGDASGSGSNASPSPGTGAGVGDSPTPPPPSSTPPPSAPPPSGTPPAAPPPGSGTAPIPDPGSGPVTPFTLTITSAPQRGVKLEWTAVAGANGYRIERDIDANDGVDNFVVVGGAFVAAPGETRTLTDLSLAEAINHKYRVVALHPFGATLATATASVSGDLASSINTVSNNPPLDDSLDNVRRAMATAVRYDLDHVLAVGQPGANQGTGIVNIYQRATNNSGAWVKVQTLAMQTPRLRDHFGASVAMSPNGMYLAVGIPGDDGATAGTGVDPQPSAIERDVVNSGAVQVYRYVEGAGWTPDARIKAINAGPDDAFGAAVAISDQGHLVVGAPNEDGALPPPGYLLASVIPGLGDDTLNAPDRGAVYLYGRSSAGYFRTAYLKPPVDGGGLSLYYGAALALDALGQRLAVGAPGASYNGSKSGGVIFYELTWNFTTPPQPPEALPGVAIKQHFGAGGDRSVLATNNPPSSSPAFRGLGGALAMSASGDWMAAGYADKGGQVTETGVALPSKAGQVIVYRNQGGAWAPHSWPTAPVPVSGDGFGINVSLVNGDNGLRLLVGAYGDGSGLKGLTRAADIVPEGFVAARGSGAAYVFAGPTDPSQPLVLKARLKSPDPLVDQFLGQATAITRDGNELLLSGEYKDNSSRPSGQAIFFGY